MTSALLLCAVLCAVVGLVVWGLGGGQARLRRLLGSAQEEVSVGGPPAGASAGRGRAAGGRAAESRAAGQRGRTEGEPSERGGAEAERSAEIGRSDIDALAFDLDLVAICLQAGLPVDSALEHAARASADRSGLGVVARALQLGTDAVRGLRPELETVLTFIRFSGRTGVALAPLLGAHASELRASEHRRRQIAAARLGVMLVLPLGVCVLPAFILLGVVPVLLTLVGDMLPAFG